MSRGSGKGFGAGRSGDPLARARAARARGRQNEAIAGYRQALALIPDAQGFLELGEILAEVGERVAAVAALRAAIRLQPDLTEAHRALAGLWEAMGYFNEAYGGYFQALAAGGEDPQVRRALAELCQRLGRPAEALGHCRTALGLIPDDTDLLFLTGSLLQELGRFAEAIEHYRAVIARDPGCAAAHGNLGLALRLIDRTEEAVIAYRAALALAPASAVLHTNLGLALEVLGEADEALACYGRALVLDPDDPQARAGQAALLDRRGEREAARHLLAPLVAGGSTDLKVLVTHARFARRDGDPRSVADLLERRVADVDLNPRERALLLFELGHLYDRLGAYDAAFARFQTANRLRRPAFDRAGFARLIEGIIAAGSDGVQATNRSTVPVFIVGMPRSGTSLVEQILASHPAVFGAGELNDLPRLVAEISPGYPGGLTELTAADLDRSAERYLARLASLGHGAERVTDKLPGNFLHLGIIARLFPGARIVHCLRDPLDTCLSCYFHDFGGIHPYAYDLGDLGFAYRQYECLMDHWRSTLPLPILEVRYEDLIADQEGMSRALVAFVGLDWRDECLQFHRTPRLVHTASYDQVRRPLYTSSVGRARHYHPHLGRLVEALQK